VKEKKITITKRWFYYLMLEYKNEILIHQRTKKDIWQQLYEFLLIEADKELSQQKILLQAESKGSLKKNNYDLVSISSLFKQQLSHQLIAGQFLKIKLKQRSKAKNDWFWVAKNKMNNYPFPKFINQYLEERSVEQSLF
jgi:A/G-specific adenine glycosylase